MGKRKLQNANNKRLTIIKIQSKQTNIHLTININLKSGFSNVLIQSPKKHKSQIWQDFSIGKIWLG